jgi:hypothetical protein
MNRRLRRSPSERVATMRKLVITAILALSASPAFAGGHRHGPPWPYGGCCDRPGGFVIGDGLVQPYGGGPPVTYDYPPPYGYVNGGVGPGAPPAPPPVPVQPAWCSPADTVFVPQFGQTMCKPVMVPRY